MENSQNVLTLSVNTVLNWSSDQITSNLTEILTLIKDEGTWNDEESTFHLVKFCFHDLLPLVPACDWEDNVFKTVCNKALSIFVSTIRGLESLDSLRELTQTQCDATEACTNLLAMEVDILSNLIHVCALLIELKSVPVSISLVEYFVLTTLQILTESLQHCQNALKLYANSAVIIQDLRNNTHELFGKLFVILTSRLEFATTLDEDTDLIIKFAEKLSKLSSLCLNEGVKMLSDSWKFLIAFIEKHKDILALHFNSETLLTTLSDKILKAFKEFLFFDVSCMVENITSLKLASFLLKILVKFCGIFAMHLNADLEGVLRLLLCLNQSTPSYLKSKKIPVNLVAEINKLLVIGADPLLNRIYSVTPFIQNLSRILEEKDQDDSYGKLMLLLSLMKKLMGGYVREMYSDAQVNLLHHAFVVFGACHGGMIKGKLGPPGSTTVGQPVEDIDLYEFVLIHTAAFVLSSSTLEFAVAERTLLENLLSNNPWKATLAADLWCLVARYAKAHVCHSTLSALIPAFEKLDRHRPHAVNLMSLIRRLLPLCEPQYLNNLQFEFEPILFPKFWSISTFDSSSVAADLMDIALPSLKKFVDGSNVNPKELTEVETNLYIMASIAGHIPSERLSMVSSIIVQLWELNPSSPLTSCWWSRFISAATTLTSAVLPIMSEHHMLKVLSCIDALLPKLQTCSQRLSILQILDNIAPATIPNTPQLPQILELLSSFFRQLLADPSIVVREATLRSFAVFARVTSHTEVISNAVANDMALQSLVATFLKKQLENDVEINSEPQTVEFVHRCSPKNKRNIEVDSVPNFDAFVENDETEIDYQPKRFKFDASATVQAAVERLIVDSQVIVDNATSIDVRHKLKIQRICELLRKATS